MALAAGEAALARHDGTALLAAANSLDASGAHPADNDAQGVDLAQTWRKRAMAWGARPKLAREVWRGRALGPGYRVISLPARGEFHTRQIFVAGQKARVEMVAPSASSFSLRVLDDAHAPVCQRDAIATQLACAWVPIFSLPHEITIASRGATPARLYLLTD
jgi:hypothetical protein